MKSKLVDNVLSYAFPKNFTCDICGIEVFKGTNLCPECLNKITFNNQATCPVCGRKTTTNSLCFECKDLAPLFKKAVSPLVYKEGAVALVHKFKSNSGYLKEYFADLIAPKCADFVGAQAICYVPMTKKAIKKRGYNQSELLAKALSERLQLPILYDALTKIRETAEQKNLTRKEREENLGSCFKADKQLVENKVLILVDDVLTTGATAETATKALLKAGAKTVYFATIASVEYKREM
jgi:ComF family protein